MYGYVCVYPSLLSNYQTMLFSILYIVKRIIHNNPYQCYYLAINFSTDKVSFFFFPITVMLILITAHRHCLTLWWPCWHEANLGVRSWYESRAGLDNWLMQNILRGRNQSSIFCIVVEVRGLPLKHFAIKSEAMCYNWAMSKLVVIMSELCAAAMHYGPV